MLAPEDYATISRMLKERLENLILKRANERSIDQINASLDEEIDNLYILLSKTWFACNPNASAETTTSQNVETIQSNDLLDTLRYLKELLTRMDKGYRFAEFTSAIRSQSNLADKLVGTCWRKRNNVEVIIFRDKSTFDCIHTSDEERRTHEYILGDELGSMRLHWKTDNFVAVCEFNSSFTRFTEMGRSQLTWRLEWVP